MRTLQEGDLTVRIVSDREDELGQMSRNFNIMANELEQSVQDKVCLLYTSIKKLLVAMRLGDTPVLIPNTMVKTQAADGTILETVWELSLIHI